MKRLFAAVRVQPDGSFMQRFSEMKQALSHERIKWVGENNIHVTLKFFGDTDVSKIPEIISVFNQISGMKDPFSFRLNTLGIFGSRYAPRVVWAGIDPYEPLLDLMKTIHNELKAIGFEPDRQNLVPHLTLGRIREIRDRHYFQQTIDRFGDLSSQEMIVGEFILYESILRKEGPVYIAQGAFVFGQRPVTVQ